MDDYHKRFIDITEATLSIAKKFQEQISSAANMCNELQSLNAAKAFERINPESSELITLSGSKEEAIKQLEEIREKIVSQEQYGKVNKVHIKIDRVVSETAKKEDQTQEPIKNMPNSIIQKIKHHISQVINELKDNSEATKEATKEVAYMSNKVEHVKDEQKTTILSQNEDSKKEDIIRVETCTVVNENKQESTDSVEKSSLWIIQQISRMPTFLAR